MMIVNNMDESIVDDIDRKNAILNKVYVIGMVVFAVVTAGLLVAMVAR